MKLNFFRKGNSDSEKPKKVITKKQKIIFAAVGIVVIALLVFAGFKLFGGKKTENVINTAKADKGDIQLIVSGTGTVEANDQYNVTSLVKGEIMESPFEEGDVVEKGDLLYKIDTTDVENSLERSKISMEKTQNSYNQTKKEFSKLTVTAPVTGTITTLYVNEGDTVGSNTKIADIVDTSKMILTIPFIDEHVSQYVSVGNSALVTLQNTNDNIYGVVTKVVTGTYVNTAGVIVRNVEITVDNPGAIKEGDKATALVGDAACNDSGTFKNNASKTVTAEVSGTVKTLPYSQGDRVNAGAVLAKLESESLENSMTSSELSLRESQLSLENTYNTLEDYSITAPISGTVIQKTSKAGDTLDNTNSSVTMAVIADMSKILFTMAIDELDISKIEEGQEVSITADALTNKVFSGYVEEVSIVGTSSNGVTTYPVTIVINEPEGLIPGMNVSADIIIEKKENVVRVPVSAVRRGNVVAVKGAENKNDKKASEQEEPKNSEKKDKPAVGGGIPEGFTAVRVETGINDDNYIEIVSGISEGDEVWVPQTSTTTTNTQQMPGGMGGMGGGMPGGGMPGGMSGGGRPGGGMMR